MSLSRRNFLRATYGTAGVATLLTVGESVTPLHQISLLAPRVPTTGTQHLPVNRSAKDARITPAVTDDFTLAVDGPRPFTLTLAQLRAMPEHTADLPISCVEGWSVMARWSGVRIKDLLDQAGISHDTRIKVESLEKTGSYRTSILDTNHARDHLTLLATKLRGAVLAPDHGYPLRLISPDRPGVLQTKWVHKIGPA